MKQAIALTFSGLLLFLALGMGIIAHATYTAEGQIDGRIAGYAGGAILSLVVGCAIAIRATRDKPIDLTEATNSNVKGGLRGVMTMGTGAVILLFVVPMVHSLLARDIAQPGSGLSFNDFPIEALRPALQRVVETMGPLGISIPLACVGLICVAFGWRRVRGRRA